MNPRTLISFLGKIEALKCNTRHSWTSTGRHESVAEHSWRLAVMAMLCTDEYPELDIDKVIKMCLIHDFGEAITGDIPAFDKTEAHENAETLALTLLLSYLPDNTNAQLTALFGEMQALKTPEARLYKALDNLEAIISHNEAHISTWLPREYHDNLVYGEENAAWSDYTKELRRILREDSEKKIARESSEDGSVNKIHSSENRR